MVETIFQHFIFQEFILPFLLVFTIIFAVLEKTKLLGEDKKRLSAIIAFVVGLVFVTSIFPKTVISHLILFLTVSLILVFVVLLLWGFITGEGGQNFQEVIPKKTMKWILIILVAGGIIFLLIWTLGINTGVLDWVLEMNWGGPFLTNILFVITVAVALSLVLSKAKSNNKK